jgi:CpeT/CpcT family (DUF1001)
MPDSSAIALLATWLAGEFDNQPQAQEQPIWFVHLRLWHRPLPYRIGGNIALFAEQANALYPDNPYRQRVAVLSEVTSELLQVQYFALQHPEHFSGSGANAALLNDLTADHLEALPGCALQVRHDGDRFYAEPRPDARCFFTYQGQQRQVILGFDVGDGTFSSYDRGVDPETGTGLWGALMGPYLYSKCVDFSDEIPI